MRDVGWKKQKWIFAGAIIGIVIFDQIVKYLAKTHLMDVPGGVYEFIPGFFNFTYTENTGAAFSLFSDATWALAAVSIVMACVILYILYRYRDIRSRLFHASLCFIAGGAIGNVIDRLFRGYVVDMLEFAFVRFAVFNVADSFVCIGAVMLGVFVIWFWEKHKKEPAADGKPKNEKPKT